MPIKFHRSYSVYFGTWGSIPYIVDDYGQSVILDHETIGQTVYFLMGQ